METVVGTWDVEETVEVRDAVIGGKLVPVTITRRKGLCEYQNEDGSTFLADGATFKDYGPKLGISRAYDLHPEEPYTEAEKAAGRARIQEVAARIITEQGLWDKIGRPG